MYRYLIDWKLKISKCRFPIERVLGPYFEDGKCELDLEVWKHPERTSHIGICLYNALNANHNRCHIIVYFSFSEYEIFSETGSENDKESKAKVYLIIHGDHSRTGKIELNDGNFENSVVDNYEFVAPDVGKIEKIELFYLPLDLKSKWQLESLQIKVKARTEAYKYKE